MAVCDVDYKFLLVDIGDSGHQSDAGLPQPRYFRGYDEVNFPYVFVGDEALPLKINLVKPYPHNLLNDGRRIFNYRLSRARRVIENTFGICASRFRIFRRSINGTVKHATEITKAAVALHNFLMDDRKMYCPSGFGDCVTNGMLKEGSWRDEENFQGALLDIKRVPLNNFTLQAKEVRDSFCEYFMTDIGCVSWQQNAVNSTADIFDSKVNIFYIYI
ncbi:uncharacterized protein LOC130637024 [Hydractinia symbiolongicarpus]|uniref:uncharacterized protein LOC130637024 n=1 Tax=Hydractinia symbiolongicarpus TaxID=13093 RepID=UPI0025509C4A|nr:uncharacterized protein LOC130637024 [Hydractinia symbiolongicarpus]